MKSPLHQPVLYLFLFLLFSNPSQAQLGESTADSAFTNGPVLQQPIVNTVWNIGMPEMGFRWTRSFNALYYHFVLYDVSNTILFDTLLNGIYNNSFILRRDSSWSNPQCYWKVTAHDAPLGNGISSMPWHISLDLQTGVQEQGKITSFLFPNPVRQGEVVRLLGEKALEWLEIWDNNGRRIFYRQYSETVSFSNFVFTDEKPGLYWVRSNLGSQKLILIR